MSFEDSLSKGVFFGFVPHRLEIKERPELSIFPFNVLFVQNKVVNGKTIIGSALYEPNLESFKIYGEIRSMEYHNVYGGKSWLVIIYDVSKESYLGKKIVNGESVGMAVGMQWNMFFVHFTALGLANGEACELGTRQLTISTEIKRA